MILKKKGVSPVIATVLLVAIVVVIGLIIFFWFRSFTKDAITKFDNQNVEILCQDISFQANYQNGILTISNNGNIPIYDFNLKVEKNFGGYSTFSIREDVDDFESEYGLIAGKTIIFQSSEIGTILSDSEKIEIIPILLGAYKKQQKTYVCGDEFGKEIQS